MSLVAIVAILKLIMGMVKINKHSEKRISWRINGKTQHCLGKIGGIAFPTLASPHICAKQQEGLDLGNSWQQM